ncbi:MAG: adenosylcobinamide-GDP ribazoletransferase, partial [Chloroflexi bacterium]|nr:adenosylcobinamide-GDP ribazoletransferase [Chloroflexota bacterium]
MLAALAFLTRLPIPAARSGRFESGVPWFPAVGLVLGAILALADLGLRAIGFSLLVDCA